MRLTFICSALEPGRDGVGDYTRRLAESLQQAGHTTQIIALNDRHVPANAHAGSLRPSERDEIRLSSGRTWPERVRSAREVVHAFRPDWVSVQFVSFGFDNRGFVWRLGERLKQVVSDVPTQIMFHELWRGDGHGASPRERIEGFVQKQLILQAVRTLRPAVVHTHASAYVALLQKSGIAATRLPLFSNVPIAVAGGATWLHAAVIEAGVQTAGIARENQWWFGFFGSLHPQWQPEPLFSSLQAAARMQRKVPVIVAVGRLGVAGDRLWSELQRANPNLTFVSLGEQPADRVSQALHALDFGITATPLALIGKSGAAAAMLTHGLPVIVSRNDITFPFEFDAPESRHPSLIPLDAAFCDRLVSTPRRPPHDPRDDVARQFMTSLEAAARCG